MKSLTLQMFILSEPSPWKQQFPSLYFALQPHLSIFFWYSLGENCVLQGRHIHILTPQITYLIQKQGAPRSAHIGMRSYWIILGPNPMTSICTRRRSGHPGRPPCDCNSRDQRDPSASQDCQGILAITRGWEKAMSEPSPEPSEGAWPFRCSIIIFAFLSHPVGSHF